MSQYLCTMCLIHLMLRPLHQASWLEELPKKDLMDWQDPTGKVQTQIFRIKFNVSVAATKLKPKASGRT